MKLSRLARMMLIISTLTMLLAGAVIGAAAQQEELLTNTGFEQVRDGVPVSWTARGHVIRYPYESGEVSVTSEAARTGQYGIKMVHETKATDNYWLTQGVAVEGGQEYEASMWVKSDLGEDARTAIKFEFRDANGQHIGKAAGGELQKDWHNSAAEWEQQVFRFVAPENAVRASILFRLYAPGVAYIDDVSMRPVKDDEVDLSALANPQAVKEVLSGLRQEADVSWWGFDPEDSTEYLQAAIDSGVKRLIIPNMGQDWIVRPIMLRSDLELVFEEGVVVSAKKGEYLGRQDAVFTARDAENLILRGYGATIRMHKDDYTKPPYERAEWRHGLNIRGSKNVEILGLTIEDTGGDAIYLGRGGENRWNENVVIRDVVADNNHRQGISIITVKGLLIEDSVFKNTTGTPPMAGLDFEPNHPDEKMEDIIVRNTVFDMNETYGITLNVQRFNSDAYVSILMENILVRGSSYGVVIGTQGAEGQQPSGEVILRNCIVEGSTVNAIRVGNRFRDEDSEPMKVRIENCIVHDAVQNPPILREISPSSVPIALRANSWLESVHFEDVVVVDSIDRPVLHGGVAERVGSTGDGLRDISGEIQVVNPYGGATMVWDERSENITLKAVERPSVTIAYDEIISLPEYQFPSVEVKVGPAVRVSNLASYVFPPTVLQGKFVPEIQLLNLDEGNVEHAEVYLDDQSIYSGSGLPEPGVLEIDTRTLFDDRHQLEIVIRAKDVGEIRSLAYFQTQNFNHIMDPIEGPREVAWFGKVYNPIVVDQSDGWQYETGNPADFLGDGSRKHREGNTTEYLVWETPDLWDATFELYAQSPAVEDVVVVEASMDGRSWQALSYTVDSAGKSSAGWNKLIVEGSVSGDVRVDKGEAFKFVRLVFKQTDTLQDIYLGQAFFRMLRR